MHCTVVWGHSSHPPQMERNPLKTVCGCPCGEVIKHWSHPVECTCQCTTACTWWPPEFSWGMPQQHYFNSTRRLSEFVLHATLSEFVLHATLSEFVLHATLSEFVLHATLSEFGLHATLSIWALCHIVRAWALCHIVRAWAWCHTVRVWTQSHI